MPADTASPRPSAARKAKSDAAAPFAATSDEAMETLKRTSDSLNQIAGECAAICSDGLSAAIETGTESSRLFTEVGKSYMEACTTLATTFAEIGRETMTCRTPADVINLQKRALEGVNASVTATGKLYGGLFEAWSKAADPLVSRAADGPQRFFRAFAD